MVSGSTRGCQISFQSPQRSTARASSPQSESAPRCEEVAVCKTTSRLLLLPAATPDELRFFQGSTMLDAQFIREHLDEVKANVRHRNVKADVDRIVQLDDERKRLAQETQLVQQRQNEVARLVKAEKDPAKKQALIQEGKDLKAKVAGLEQQMK